MWTQFKLRPACLIRDIYLELRRCCRNMQIGALLTLRSTPILTVGYGQRSVTDVIELARRHLVNFVIDVRTTPASTFQPDFNREALQSRLQDAGIRYVFMGDSLGGRPQDPTCYLDGHVVYERVRQKEFFNAGLERLRNDRRAAIAFACSVPKQSLRIAIEAS